MTFHTCRPRYNSLQTEFYYGSVLPTVCGCASLHCDLVLGCRGQNGQKCEIFVVSSQGSQRINGRFHRIHHIIPTVPSFRRTCADSTTDINHRHPVSPQSLVALMRWKSLLTTLHFRLCGDLPPQLDLLHGESGTQDENGQ